MAFEEPIYYKLRRDKSQEKQPVRSFCQRALVHPQVSVPFLPFMPVETQVSTLRLGTQDPGVRAEETCDSRASMNNRGYALQPARAIETE